MRATAAEIVYDALSPRREEASLESDSQITSQDLPEPRRVVLIGPANSGKSTVFNWLTSTYSPVANYPQTTLELVSVPLVWHDREVVVVDTPGISALTSQAESARSTLDTLYPTKPSCIVLVGDSTRLKATLVLLAQILELEIPTVLCLNKSDEAARLGRVIDDKVLSRELGITVLQTSGLHGLGLDGLVDAVEQASSAEESVRYTVELEAAIQRIEELFAPQPLPSRGLVMLFLEGDETVEILFAEALEADAIEEAKTVVSRLRWMGEPRVSFTVFQARQDWADRRAENSLHKATLTVAGLGERAAWASRHPVLGWPILLGVLWLILNAVGVLASQMAGVLDGVIFTPLTGAIASMIGQPFIRDLLVGDFGLLTMGLFNALVTVVPILLVFFFIIHCLEDIGYLPNLGVLANRTMSRFGLTGKAVLPMVTGTGCNTMATLTTRMLDSPRERRIATFLVALGIPCAVQLGVMLAILATAPFSALLIVLTTVAVTMIVCGVLLHRLMPGDDARMFITELPSFRWPTPRNVALKTYYQTKWFLAETIPMFVFAAALMFGLDKTGLLQVIKTGARPVVSDFLDLPDKIAEVFILVLSRREVGAVYFKDMVDAGELDYIQIVVGLVVMTLFIPCISNTMVMVKEVGVPWTVGSNLGIIAIAILVGGIVNSFMRMVL